MPERMMAIEVQMERFLSDIEREEEARELATATLSAKMDKLAEKQDKTTRILYMMLGGLMVLQVVLQIVLQLFHK